MQAYTYVVRIRMYMCVYFTPQIDALGEVVEAVKGRVEVYLDGGIRQGTDVLKALALGAKAVFIGRPVLWGLSYQVHCTTMGACKHIIFVKPDTWHVRKIAFVHKFQYVFVSALI